MLNPRDLPKSHAKNLQDLLDLHIRFAQDNSTRGREMWELLVPAVLEAYYQLNLLTRAAATRMVKGE